MREDLRWIPIGLLAGLSLWAPRATAQTPVPAPAEAAASGEREAEPAPVAPEATNTEPPAQPEVAGRAPAVAVAQPALAPPPGPPPESLIPDGEAPARPIAPAFPPAIPNIDYGGRLRAVLKLQSPTDPEKVDDVAEQVEADLYMSGQVHRFLKWQVALTLAYAGVPGASSSVNVQPLDVIGRFEPLPELNIYMGRMLVMADRFAPGGPWGMDEFFFPGFFPLIAAPALPKAGALGRDVGTTIWGAPLKGHLKYYLGAFNLYDPGLNPLLTGRIQVSLLNGEPAFYHRTTYFGSKDLISLGVGGQYQKAGSVQPVPVTTPPTVPLTDDYEGVFVDATVEKNLGDSGTLSVIGAFSKFYGDFQRWDNMWLASVGYMMPKPVGIGKPRVTLRYQRGLDHADGASASSLIDAQLSYNIAAWFARFQLGYRRGESFLAATMAAPARTQPSNMIYLGMTLADP